LQCCICYASMHRQHCWDSLEWWQALEDAITKQHEQERSIENEIDAYRKDIVREQIRNEQLTAVMTKLEGESGFLQTQNDTMVRKQEKLQVGRLHLHLQIHQSQHTCSLGNCIQRGT